MQTIRFESIDLLREPAALSTIFGPGTAVEVQALPRLGFSHSRFERIRVRLPDGQAIPLLLKHVDLADEWEAVRTDDTRGRETLALSESALAAVWEIIECPYRAFATGPGMIGLLMNDLSDHLFPDVREPVDAPREDALLAALARLHARFWETEALRCNPGLLRPAAYHRLLGPGAAERLPYPPPALQERMRRGWEVALNRLPPHAAEALRTDAVLAEACQGLPHTLLHGDPKVANLVVLGDGRVSAFDWAMIGAGPATIELGWYLAVNASRLARPKEAVIARYRSHLEAALGRRLDEALWDRLLAAGLLCGCVMLLWSKAAALDTGSAAAAHEWSWWESRLLRSLGR
jgi:hypothetical protein